MLWSSSLPGTPVGRSTRRNILVSLVCNQRNRSLQKYFLAVIATGLELARGNSAGIELFHETFVAELFHKPIVNELGDERFGGLARHS